MSTERQIDAVVEADARSDSKAWWKAIHRISVRQINSLQHDEPLRRFVRRVGRDLGVTLRSQVRSNGPRSGEDLLADLICKHKIR